MGIVLNSGVIDSLVASCRFSRAIWIDVEPRNGVERPHTDFSDGWDIVLRGWDKTLSGAKASTAASAEDRKEHKPAIVWNDEAGATRRYVIATCDTLSEAETVQAQLVDFYAVLADESQSPTFTDRYESCGTMAKQLIPSLLALFGSQPSSECFAGSTRIGSYADHLANKAPKAKVVKSKVKSAEDAQKALAAVAAFLNNGSSPAPVNGAADLQSQLANMLAQLQSLQN